MPIERPPYVIMDQDDELARLKAMNADLVAISKDLDGVVRALTAAQIENKILKAQIQALRETLKDCVISLLKLPDTEGAYRLSCIHQANRALDKTFPALNQSSGD